jgi:lysine 2,3-aminomutase
MVGPDGLGTLTAEELQAAYAYIAADPAVWEVILTGGDPLMLSPRRLEEIIEALSAIAHVRVIRLHSRVPVVDPQRVTAPLVAALRKTDRAVYVAVHANHPREFTPVAREAIARLADAGVPLLGQSVLLADINDDADTLGSLMRVMVENRVKPYYLHHPDLAPGTAHFRVSIERGRALTNGLRGHFSGLCQPTYVLDLPGGHGKVPLDTSACEGLGEGRHRLTDFRGRRHLYPPPLD